MKYTKKPWKIDSEFLAMARVDVGPEDGVSIIEACCSAYIAGADAEEEIGNARLIVAATAMYELIDDLSQAYDHNKPSHDLAAKLYDLRCKAVQLLAKIDTAGATRPTP